MKIRNITIKLEQTIGLGAPQGASLLWRDCLPEPIVLRRGVIICILSWSFEGPRSGSGSKIEEIVREENEDGYCVHSCGDRSEHLEGFAAVEEEFTHVADGAGIARDGMSPAAIPHDHESADGEDAEEYEYVEQMAEDSHASFLRNPRSRP